MRSLSIIVASFAMTGAWLWLVAAILSADDTILMHGWRSRAARRNLWCIAISFLVALAMSGAWALTIKYWIP